MDYGMTNCATASDAPSLDSITRLCKTLEPALKGVNLVFHSREDMEQMFRDAGIPLGDSLRLEKVYFAGARVWFNEAVPPGKFVRPPELPDYRAWAMERAGR